jgi:ribosomal 30S subunit maturation factor RimM
MEYIIGFLSAFVFVFLFIQIQYRYDVLKENIKLARSSQSTRHTMVGAAQSFNLVKTKKRDSQSNRHDKNINIKVIIMDDQAYWIKDNTFYMADMSHGNVDKETTRVVDTMTMNKVQLDKMIFIIDRLREEAFDDRWGSGY